ncbi:MAG TPA: D-alanine--D-alanine ligase family protein [Gaiella sp.]|nr:D-alanine--D-alanine ligase family protein [Gaiella sp.]
MSRRVRVAVLAGGRSSEHAISLASAASVVAALDPERYEVRTVEIGRDGRWALPAGDRRAALASATTAETLPVPADSAPATLGSADVVLPILHGPFGEDGTVQGLCELAGVAYVGPGVLASSVCMDKDVFKTLMRGAGIPVARHVALRLGDPVTNPFGYPVFVKPANMGSSVGISKVREEGELEPAVALARRHDEKVMVEEFVAGMEIEVGVLGNLPSPVASLPGQVLANNADWYDYSSKYDEGGSELVVPPPGLTEAQIERARQLAIDAFVATSCEGMARADFFVREADGEILMNELNTIPGFTATSFYSRLFAATGIEYEGLLDRLIALALERHERRSGLQY